MALISNGYKVIGIEEDGNVEYDDMSSCPVSEFLQCRTIDLVKKNCIQFRCNQGSKS